MKSKETPNLRPSPIAGQWYPDDPHLLAESVDSYLDNAQLPELSGKILGVVAPHAGHRYSGPVAGYAYKAVHGAAPDLVVVLSPMHHPHLQPLITSAHDGYLTPLGPVLIDHDAVRSLDASLQTKLGQGLTPIYRDSEHALEIQLPFLQHVLPGAFKLLPVMMRDQGETTARALGQALAETLAGREILLVASTDLSHFYNQTAAKQLDSEVLRRIEAFDPEQVVQVEQEGLGFACGRGAVAAVLWAAQALGAVTVKILHYATSGDVTGDYSAVVGYGAAAILTH